MYGLIHLSDGSAEYVPNADRFQSLVPDRLGRDAADIVAELIRQADVATHVVESDLLAYESENEALIGAVLNASEMTEKLREEIVVAARINRAQLAEKLAAIERTLAAVVYT